MSAAYVLDRVVAFLREQEEPVTHAEIAEAIEVPESMVRRTIRRADAVVDLVAEPDAEIPPDAFVCVGLRPGRCARPSRLWVLS